jgi:hypothetical protein
MSKTKTATIDAYEMFQANGFCVEVKYYGKKLNTFVGRDLNGLIVLAKSIATTKGFQKTKVNILKG